MGNSQSTSQAVSDIVNTSMTNVLMSSSNNCGQNNSASQQLDFNDISAGQGCNLSFDGISQKLIQTPNFTCSSNSNNESQLMASFQSQLDQNANAAVSGLPSALNSQAISQTISKLKTDISNNIQINQVSNCVQNNIAEQKMKFGKISTSCPAYCNNPLLCKGVESLCDMSKCTTKFSNISQDLTQAAVSSCLASNANLTKVISDVSNKISQTAESKNTGISMAGIASSLIPLLIIVCIILSVYLYISGAFS